MNINGVHKEIIIIIENEKCEIFFLGNKKRKMPKGWNEKKT